MSDDSDSFGSTLADGIQDVAAIVGILGTEMCDDNAGMALQKGYMFPAACATSMFGILGLAKSLLKLYVPKKIAENMGLDLSKFDKYVVDKKTEDVLMTISEDYAKGLKLRGATVRLQADNLDVYWLLMSFLSCFCLSCLNFIPYLSHYYHTPELTDVHYPLLLTVSSIFASFVCCLDAAMMLSGYHRLYSMKKVWSFLLKPNYWGNWYTWWTCCIFGILSIIGSVISYIGSYMIIQQMSTADTYIWLVLELLLCVLRLFIWSWNTKTDDIGCVRLFLEMDISEEALIKVLSENAEVLRIPNMTEEEAKNTIDNIGKSYVDFYVLWYYLQAQNIVTSKDFMDREHCKFESFQSARCFILYDTDHGTVSQVLVLAGGKGVLLGLEQLRMYVKVHLPLLPVIKPGKPRVDFSFEELMENSIFEDCYYQTDPWKIPFVRHDALRQCKKGEIQEQKLKKIAKKLEEVFKCLNEHKPVSPRTLHDLNQKGKIVLGKQKPEEKGYELGSFLINNKDVW
ncbi:unnamed protein product [Rhizopus stolonifer]